MIFLNYNETLRAVSSWSRFEGNDSNVGQLHCVNQLVVGQLANVDLPKLRNPRDKVELRLR